jgi:hypothetical protein
MAFLTQSTAVLCKNLIVALVFRETPFFSQKMSKIAKNSDH